MVKTLNGEKGNLGQAKYHVFVLKRGVEFIEELY